MFFAIAPKNTNFSDERSVKFLQRNWKWFRQSKARVTIFPDRPENTKMVEYNVPIKYSLRTFRQNPFSDF